MDKGKNEVYLAALAGLLHDVGKFGQRANEKDRYRFHAEVGSEIVSSIVPQQWRAHLYPVMGHHDQPLQGYETKVVALADRLSAGERADEKQEQPKQLLSIFCRLETLDRSGNPQRAPSSLYWPLRPLALEEKTLFPQAECQEQAALDGYKALWKSFVDEVEILRDAQRKR